MPWQTSSQLKALPNCSSQRWHRQMGTQSSSAPSSAFVLQGRGCGAQPACTTAALPRDRSTNCSHQNCCSPLTDQLNSQCAKAHALISEDSPSPLGRAHPAIIIRALPALDRAAVNLKMQWCTNTAAAAVLSALLAHPPPAPCCTAGRK